MREGLTRKLGVNEIIQINRLLTHGIPCREISKYKIYKEPDVYEIRRLIWGKRNVGGIHKFCVDENLIQNYF